MDKQTILKAFYISKIAELVEQCNDVSMLNLIYQLLTKEGNQ